MKTGERKNWIPAFAGMVADGHGYLGAAECELLFYIGKRKVWEHENWIPAFAGMTLNHPPRYARWLPPDKDLRVQQRKKVKGKSKNKEGEDMKKEKVSEEKGLVKKGQAEKEVTQVVVQRSEWRPELKAEQKQFLEAFKSSVLPISELLDKLNISAETFGEWTKEAAFHDAFEDISEDGKLDGRVMLAQMVPKAIMKLSAMTSIEGETGRKACLDVLKLTGQDKPDDKPLLPEIPLSDDLVEMILEMVMKAPPPTPEEMETRNFRF